eukprot:CAMPEP_0184864776 /NCGR_PEP_ID=MMETSP0580-20130426/16085_1 /TAXON_ID=1118495 /ORGANISM="Dactyliosolen fragilissimus" /LENGTH=494 /DNA_ID=CAMNT_0027363695 /DNA_START=10 /DNA_END=1494 /DNA_ORIENTATION=-
MTGGTVVSNAALATLQGTTKQFETDPLVTLVCTVASPLQLSLKIQEKGCSSDGFTLEIDNGSTLLTQRNAILRALCSSVLHDALDGAPNYLFGGHSARARNASPSSALAVSGISSWMSYADSIDASTLTQIAENLNDYLATRSFLIPSAGPTLADLDVYFTLSKYEKEIQIQDVIKGKLHLSRWMEQCYATASEMLSLGTQKKLTLKAYTALPSITITQLVPPTPEPISIFYYGDEGEDVLTSSFVSSTANPETKSNNKKETKDAKQSNEGTKQKDNSSSPPPQLTDEQKAAAEKRAKKAAEKAAKKKNKADAGGGGKNANSNAPAADIDISKLDIRVGKIIKAWDHPDAEKLYCEEVDVGEDKPRSIASGLRPFYKLEEMQNRDVLVLCNLKQRNLVGFPSHGMVLCASNADHTSVEFVIPPSGTKVGERVTFEGFQGEPEAENKLAKKKMFEKLAPDLKTDDEGVVVWKDAKSITSAGPCVASKGMKNAQVS